MKKLTLVACLISMSIGVSAQSTLTAATNNPIPGDKFTIHDCSRTGVLPGSAGAAVIWNFRSLISSASINYNFLNCTSTSYCDSFPTTNLMAQVATSLATQIYYHSNTSLLELTGEYLNDGVAGLYYYPNPNVVLKYPITYNSSYMDTSLSYRSPASTYGIIHDSIKVDGYGTLILPTGTYTNALRVHRISNRYDSTITTGHYNDISLDMYAWFAPGYHLSLLEIVFDLIDITTPNLVNYTTLGTTEINSLNNDVATIEVNPNPVSDLINIKLAPSITKNALVTLTDVTGNVIDNISTESIISTSNNIQFSVANKPAGLYFLHVTDGEININKKIIVIH